MALIMDTPRTATVVARTAVDCYRLDRAAFKEIIGSQPAVAAEVSAIMAKRQLELHAVVANLDAEIHARQLAETHNDLLLKIRQFFSLDE